MPKESDHKRCFIGLGIPSPTSDSLLNIQSGLSGLSQSIRTTPKTNLHLTLKFLGKTTERQRETLAQELHELAKSISPSEALAEGISAFPDEHQPRAIYSKISDGHAEIIKLGNSIETICIESGFDAETKTRIPHITIARIPKAGNHTHLTQWIQNNRHQIFGPLPLSEIVLFESLLSPDGSVYHPLQRFEFSKA
ncbi:RNA 2',3'-cyclic phosphodiesterase [Myxococcota bacterium]|nr:RNA 2',3'-cyclic phosphodiesterase [Myxococcota bacterium]